MNVIDYPEIKKANAIKKFEVKDGKIFTTYKVHNYITGAESDFDDEISLGDLSKAKSELQEVLNNTIKTLEGLDLLIKDAQMKILGTEESKTE